MNRHYPQTARFQINCDPAAHTGSFNVFTAVKDVRALISNHPVPRRGM